jgi:hypothetical protein
MPECPFRRDQRPWNKGLLIGQKKPLEPKHIISAGASLGRKHRLGIDLLWHPLDAAHEGCPDLS